MIPPQWGMLTIGAFPITLPAPPVTSPNKIRVSPNARPGRPRDRATMSEGFRYPVLFCRQGDPPKAGSLSIVRGTIVLAGGSGSNSSEIWLEPQLITDLRTSRAAAERLNGYPVLVIEQETDTSPLLVAPLGAGLLSELARLFYTLTAESADSERVTVVLPLKPGSRDQARSLIQNGPPFPTETLNRIHHAVYLEDDSVIFVFDGPHAQSVVRRLLRRPSLWRASLRWHELAAGPPHTTTTGTPPTTSSELLYTSPQDRTS